MLKYVNDRNFKVEMQDLNIKNLKHIVNDCTTDVICYDFNIVHRDALRSV